MSDYSPPIEKAHPNALRWMNEDFYFSPIDETGPFGSDDGADAFAGFQDWRKNNNNENPVVFLAWQIDYWGYPKFDINETHFEKLIPYLKQNELGTRFMVGIDAAIAAIAFGQLYLEGTIDKGFKEIAAVSIQRQLLPQMLNLWGEYKAEREPRLKKMLAALNQVN